MAKRKSSDPRREVLIEVAKEVDESLGAPEALTPERIALAYRRVFQSPDGEVVLADLKAKFNGSCVRFRPGGVDPLETHYREGQRDLYLHLVEYLTPPPKPQQEDDE